MPSITGSFTATGQSATITPERGESAASVGYNITLSGTFVGTVIVERSFDGSTFHPLTALGASISFTAACSETFEEPEVGVQIRLRCSSYTSGTIDYRLSH